MTIIDFIALGVAVIAVLIAIWQALLSKAQLNESKRTKDETEKLLDEIKNKVFKIELISDETRKDVKDQITRLIDKQDENFKTLLNAPKDKNQTDLMMSLLPSLLQNPEKLTSLIELSNKLGR